VPSLFEMVWGGGSSDVVSSMSSSSAQSCLWFLMVGLVPRFQNEDVTPPCGKKNSLRLVRYCGSHVESFDSSCVR
jgi:hypothetical protein